MLRGPVSRMLTTRRRNDTGSKGFGMNAMQPAWMSSSAFSAGPEITATRGIRRVSALDHLQAVHRGRVAVDEDQIREDHPHHRQPVLSGRRDEGHVAVRLEQLGGGVADRLLVVDDQDGEGFGAWSTHSRRDGVWGIGLTRATAGAEIGRVDD